MLPKPIKKVKEKKRKKKSNVKKLQERAGKLWKEICYLRDGKQCMVKKYYPNINTTHSDIYQVDHGITRSNKHTFFEVANGTVVCSNCNMAKNYKNKSVERAIDQIIIDREGQDIFDRMVLQDQELGPNVNFSRVWWLEEQIEILEEIKNEMSE